MTKQPRDRNTASIVRNGMMIANPARNGRPKKTVVKPALTHGDNKRQTVGDLHPYLHSRPVDDEVCEKLHLMGTAVPIAHGMMLAITSTVQPLLFSKRALNAVDANTKGTQETGSRSLHAMSGEAGCGEPRPASFFWITAGNPVHGNSSKAKRRFCVRSDHRSHKANGLRRFRLKASPAADASLPSGPSDFEHPVRSLRPPQAYTLSGLYRCLAAGLGFLAGR